MGTSEASRSAGLTHRETTTMLATVVRGMAVTSNADAYKSLASGVSWPEACNKSLAEMDPEMADIIEREKSRQWKGLELIPSENFTSRSVMEVVGSVMTNKYS